MTTLQPGTKVLIEATVVKSHDLMTKVEFESGMETTLKNSDLTVCETAEVDKWQWQYTGTTDDDTLLNVIYHDINREGIKIGDWIRYDGMVKKGEPFMWLPIIGRDEALARLNVETQPFLQSPTPSFKAGQEVEFVDDDGEMTKTIEAKSVIEDKPIGKSAKATYYFTTKEGVHVGEDESGFVVMSTIIRPIPAQPTVESELREILWTGAGHASMCWEPRPSGVFDEKEANVAAKNMYDQVIAWHQKHSDRVEVSVPTFKEYTKWLDENVTSERTKDSDTYRALQHFMTKEIQK